MYRQIALKFKNYLFREKRNTGPGLKPFKFWTHYTYLALELCINSKYHKWFSAIPFQFDPTIGQLVLTNSKWKWYRWKFNIVLTFIVWSWLIGICLKDIAIGNFDIENSVGLIRMIYCCELFLVLLLTFIISIHLKSITILFNACFIVYEKFKDNFDNTYTAWKDIFCYLGIIVFSTVVRFIIFGFHALYLLSCDASVIGTMFRHLACENGQHTSYGMLPVWLLFQHYIITVGLEIITAFLLVFIPVIQIFKHAPNKLSAWPTNDTGNFTIGNYICNYRKLQLLINLANQIASKYLIPGYLVSIELVIIITCFFVIRIQAEVASQFIAIAILTVCFASLFTILFPLAQASTCIYNLHQKKFGIQSDYFTKALASCSPNGIGIGSHYILSKHIVLLYLLSILDNLVSLLVATEQQ